MLVDKNKKNDERKEQGRERCWAGGGETGAKTKGGYLNLPLLKQRLHDVSISFGQASVVDANAESQRVLQGLIPANASPTGREAKRGGGLMAARAAAAAAITTTSTTATAIATATATPATYRESTKRVGKIPCTKSIQAHFWQLRHLSEPLPQSLPTLPLTCCFRIHL